MGALTTTSTTPHIKDATPTVPPLAVDLISVTKDFGAVHAVCGVDLHIAHGEVVALLGPNSEGKTTTNAVVLGLSRRHRALSRCSAMSRTTPSPAVLSSQ